MAKGPTEYMVKDDVSIVEMQTGISIQLGTMRTQIKDLCRKMNSGSGFEGWTPPFFAVEFPLLETQSQE